MDVGPCLEIGLTQAQAVLPAASHEILHGHGRLIVITAADRVAAALDHLAA